LQRCVAFAATLLQHCVAFAVTLLQHGCCCSARVVAALLQRSVVLALQVQLALLQCCGVVVL
jgi:hypothetical protein